MWNPQGELILNEAYNLACPFILIYFVNSGFQMYSPVINYIKQRIEISREEIEETLKYSDFKKYKKVTIY